MVVDGRRGGSKGGRRKGESQDSVFYFSSLWPLTIMPDTAVNTNTFPDIVCCTESIYSSTHYLPNDVECLLYVKHCAGIPGKCNGQSTASLSARISQRRDSYMNHPAMINCDHTGTQAPSLSSSPTTQQRGHFLPKGFLPDTEKEILPLPVVGEKGES